MPTIFVPVKESLINVTRPIALNIVRELYDFTGLPADTKISFPGDLEVLQQIGSSRDEISQQAGMNLMPFTTRAFIDVDEDYEMDRVLSTATYRIENPFIFRDERIGVGIRPIYSSTDTTLNFKLRSKDKVEAMRWRDTIRSRVAMNWDQRIHKVDYHYLIPMEFLSILRELHILMERVDGYGVDFNDYMLSGLTKRATIMSNQAGSQTAWAIVESQVRIVGTFDFDLVPEKGTREDEADTWTISFAYKYKYDKPVACTMKYPLMVHNQLIPQNIRNNPLTDKLDPLDGTKYGFSFSSSLFNQFEKNTEVGKLWALNGWKGIAIPDYDEFMPAIDNIPANTVRVFTALVNIDQKNPPLLMSLKDIGDFSLHPDVLRFLSVEAQYMTKIGQSPFVINLYRGDKLLDHDALLVDDQLNVYSTYVLSLRNYFHIRLALTGNLLSISTEAIDRMRQFGMATKIIMDYIDPTMSARNVLPELMKGSDYIARIEMQKAIANMRPYNPQRAAPPKTVQQLIIQANKLDNLKG